MSPLVAILILLLLALVILVVAAPLRAREPRGGDAGPPAGTTPAPDPERAELEAAREAKLREIRDSELDYRTGKLSAEDYAAIDAQLRAEAVEILHRLDASGGEPRKGAGA